MPTETDVATLSKSESAFVIAPAGFGKTELIARAIEAGTGRSLILTHTHSGVNALKSRLNRFSVPKDRYEVATIAGWGLRYAASYPKMSGLDTAQPAGQEWTLVYEATIELLNRRAIKAVVRGSFSGIYVDEYQDCNLNQHRIVMELAQILPCRLLGDPLQGIFDFKDPTIDWQNDVVPGFLRLPDLKTPHRWLRSNPKLGDWIASVRNDLLAGRRITLNDGPASWLVASPANQRAACYQAIKGNKPTVVAIGKWPDECHDFASRMGGRFTSMEELDCRALMQFAADIDQASDGYEQVIALIAFSCQCFTAIRGELNSFSVRYSAKRSPAIERLGKNRRVVETLNQVAADGTLRSLIDAARAIENYPEANLYRRELWQEMKTSVLTLLSARSDQTLTETAWYVRDRSRKNGRKPEANIVSRTLLVKGLEFDRAVVLEANKLTAKEFYVAATRGTEALWILSKESSLRFARPENILPEY